MNKFSKINFITLFLLFFPIFIFAQTPQKIEQELVGLLDKMAEFSSYRGNYDGEKLGKIQAELKSKILSYTKTVATLKYPFESLKKKMTIATSPDGKFRIYSWDLEDGGTMHSFDGIYQFQDSSGKIYSKSRLAEGEEGDAGSFIPKIYELNTKSGKVYLPITSGIFSTQDHGQLVYAVKIFGKNLDEKVKIFKTNSGLTDSIGFGYNFFSVVDRKERPIILILFDSKTNILKIPVVIENEKFPNGEVTNRFINYKFNGTNFVKAN